MQYKYKFSVIMPIYNVENYLEKSIKSIINQSIGFKKNIQLILVNDGSPDNSDKICLKYQKKYPDNIVYIHQKNQGVSVARNNGMKYINGKYVNFFDSDDIWSKKAFENVWSFFEKHYEEVDLVACRIKFFEGQKGYHPLDYKFEKNQIIDINNNNYYYYIQLNGPTTFIKSLIIKKIKYDKKLKYGEDPYFINQIILKKFKYGIVKNSIYNYRKRLYENSAQDNVVENKDFYFNPLNHYLMSIINYSINKFKNVPKYVQTLVLYELFWRLKIQLPKSEFSDAEIKSYDIIMKKLIKQIDDDVIVNFKIVPIEYKIAFLRLKYCEDNRSNIDVNNNEISVNNKLYDAFTKCDYIEYRKFRVQDNKIIVYGRINHIFFDEDIEYYLQNHETKEKIIAKIYKIDNWSISTYNGQLISKGLLFKLEIPIEKAQQKYKNYIVLKNRKVLDCDFSCIKKYNLRKSNNTYYDIDKTIIISRDNDILVIDNYCKSLIVKKYFCKNILLLKKKKIRNLVKFNLIYPLKKFIKLLYPLKKIIILESNPDFSDSVKSVFDKLIEKGINKKYKIVWFVENCSKFDNIKIRNVEFVKFFDNINPTFKKSKIAKYYHRNAKIIIDSNKYINKTNSKQKRIHINHGSPFKNAIGYNINIGDVDHIIVQSKFFVNVESEVRDTDIKKILPFGLPRNDLLYKNDNISFDMVDKVVGKKILWLPTYKIHKKSNIKNNNSIYGLNCIKNENELNMLNEKLKKENTTIFIKFHPAEDISAFEKINLTNVVIIKDSELKSSNILLYQLFNKVDALITDYSSVYFDFCLTKKNIGLAISDIDDYVKEHGDFQFKYEDVMVGNYMYNNKDLLKFVDDISKGNDETYKKRMDLVKKYDDYRDGKSTERIYELLKKYM